MNANKKMANRQNALQSTGPRTQAGKARSRLNATKHGGYARVCIDGEDRKRFKQLLLDLFFEFRPEGFEEKFLVNEIAETIWRKNRFKAAEAKAIDYYSYANFGSGIEKGDVGTALAQDAGAYGTIPSCLAAENLLDRRLWRLFDRIKDLQKSRGASPIKSGESAGHVMGGPESD